MDDAIRREATAASADEGNYAIGATLIATVLDFQERTRVLGLAAFDRRDENVGKRENIARENLGRGRRDLLVRRSE